MKFIALSGTTDVTQNLYVYEHGNDILVVDCGVGFPEPEMYGVDLVIPDFTYLIQNKHKVKALIVTHGHEDHIGAIPFLLREIQIPVYASKLTIGFIKEKLEDNELPTNVLKVFNPEKDILTIGSFRITPFRVSHSVPDAVGFCIESSEGKMFHIPDYKFDWTPVDGRPFDVAKLALLASRDVLCLASDCLGSTSSGYTQSEAEIEGRIQTIAQEAKGQIYFTTISSNISRMQQAFRVAKRMGRKVCLIGRSVANKAKIAQELGYLSYPKELLVQPRAARKLPKDKIMYIISGSYGQPGSALYRVALGDHDMLSVGEGDTVIFSGDPAPPGSKGHVDFLVDRFIELGVIVHYYDMQEDLHVSGHGSMEDIKLLFGLVRPKYYIPIGGTIRHMRAYRGIARDMGAGDNSVLELKSGEVVEFTDGEAKRAGSIPTKDVLVDGLGIGDVGATVLRDRQILATDGVAIVIMQFDRDKKSMIDTPDIVSRGFVFEKMTKTFLNESSKKLLSTLNHHKLLSAPIIRTETINFLENYFFEETGRRPMIIPVVVEI